MTVVSVAAAGTRILPLAFGLGGLNVAAFAGVAGSVAVAAATGVPYVFGMLAPLSATDTGARSGSEGSGCRGPAPFPGAVAAGARFPDRDRARR